MSWTDFISAELSNVACCLYDCPVDNVHPAKHPGQELCGTLALYISAYDVYSKQQDSTQALALVEMRHQLVEMSQQRVPTRIYLAFMTLAPKLNSLYGADKVPK